MLVYKHNINMLEVDLLDLDDPAPMVVQPQI